jgi:hypothetical protein
MNVPTIVTRSVITLFIGGLSFVLTNAAGQSTESTVTISVFIGGVVLVVQFLAGFERSLAMLAREQASSLARVNAAAELDDDVRRSPIAVAALMSAVQRMTTISNVGGPMIAGLASAEFQRFADFVGQMSAGEVVYDGEDREWLLNLTGLAQQEIVATSSMPVDEGFWETDVGDRYLKAQVDAIQRKVVIKRLFVLDDAAKLADDSFRLMVERQTDMGLQVRALTFVDLPVSLRHSYRDYVIFDQRLYYLVQPPARFGAAAGKGAILETRLGSRPETVASAVAWFEEVWALASTPG